jgi:gliding motility-associated-like protein
VGSTGKIEPAATVFYQPLIVNRLMKKYFFIVVLFICSIPATARHVAGGELFYEYLGPAGSGSSSYRITLRLFRDCLSSGPLLQNENVTVGIFSSANNGLVTTLPLPLTGGVSSISLNTKKFPCLVGNVNVCYEMAIYTATINLPDNQAGYTLSRTGCCRIDRISNLYIPTSVGSNYVTKIPGTATLASGHNNSPQFYVRDTALVCANKSFKLDFGAQDKDGDSLTYSFCDAYTSGSGSNNAQPTALLSLIPLPYAFPYSGGFPLGAAVKINAATGLINGIAPPEGQYVVNVCITEWRNGKAFTEHRKDFILKVQNCDFVEAVLPEKIIQCKDSVVHFENLSTSSLITSYTWEFGDNSSNKSSAPMVDYPYKDTGHYVAKLTVTGPQGCVGIDSTQVYVYPGFTPAFTILGSCYLNPFQFTDLTSARYGFVDSWRWDFGDDSTAADTSILRNPKYKYLNPSKKDIGLVVTSSKGCIDSLHKEYLVGDKPFLQLPFKDTLICKDDTLAIPVLNSGSFSWLPNQNILFQNTSTPLVFPKDTTRYIVTLNDNGCTNSDTVTVNVLPFITVDLKKDSIVCVADTFRLRPISNALQYQWKSSSGVAIESVKYPLVKPLVNTKYYVKANLGHCEDRDTSGVTLVPYPTARLGKDTVICTGSRIQLRSTVIGSSFTWSPVSSLLNTNTTNPIAGPSKTTAYILRVTDTLGCPKPVSDTIVVTVAPIVVANAGNDTIALAGQQMQLNATGGQNYIWSPELGLDNPSIHNPVSTLAVDTDSIKYRVRVYDANGCYGDDDMVIRVYKTGPDIFVPSAFTPNGDGKNDVLRPVTVGISQLSYFSIFNRWGQLLYTTTEIGKGWDGLFNGVKQPSSTYVFATEGTDYLGKKVFRKGTTVLIR